VPTTKSYKVGLVLFEGFEILDVFRPVEMLGMHPDHFEIVTVAEHSGWVVSAQGPKVDWVREARWVQDGNIYTSSGVLAGMDMSLALIADLPGRDAAEDAALWAEYDWHSRPTISSACNVSSSYLAILLKHQDGPIRGRRINDRDHRAGAKEPHVKDSPYVRSHGQVWTIVASSRAKTWICQLSPCFCSSCSLQRFGLR